MITVYGTPECRQCKLTVRYLSDRSVEHEYVDIEADEAAYAAVQELGYKSVPVVAARFPGEEGDRFWTGFRPDKLEEYVTS